MDDHLFVNLRTARSLLVTAREGVKISRFSALLLLLLFPPPFSGSCSLLLSSEPLKTETSRDSGSYWSRDECKCVMWYLALFSVCDKWECFLYLADHSIFSSKSAHPALTLPWPHVLATVTFKVFHIWEAIPPHPPPPLSSPFPPIPC